MCFLFDHRLSGHKIWRKNFKSEKKNVFQFTFNVKTNLLTKVIKNTNVTN